MKVEIQLVTEKNFVSETIRFFTWSEYSHVDLVLNDGSLLGARMDGVKIRRPNYAPFTKVLRGHVNTALNLDGYKIMDAALKQVGKPYDFGAIVNLGVFHNRNWRLGDRWFCSELVTWLLEQGNVYLLNPAADVFRVTPRDVYMSPVVEWEQ